MEQHIENGPIIGFFHFTFVTRQQAGGAQKSGVVSRAWQTKVDMQQAGEAMHGHAQAGFLVKTRRAKRRQFGRHFKPATVGGFQSTITRQFGITLLNGADLLMLALGGKLHQPRAASRIWAGADLPTGHVILHQRLGPRTLWRAAGQGQFAQGSARLTRQDARTFLGQRQQAPIRRLSIGILGRDKTQCTHGPVANERQSIQRARVAQPLLTKDTIHQQ